MGQAIRVQKLLLRAGDRAPKSGHYRLCGPRGGRISKVEWIIKLSRAEEVPEPPAAKLAYQYVGKVMKGRAVLVHKVIRHTTKVKPQKKFVNVVFEGPGFVEIAPVPALPRTGTVRARRAEQRAAARERGVLPKALRSKKEVQEFFDQLAS